MQVAAVHSASQSSHTTFRVAGTSHQSFLLMYYTKNYVLTLDSFYSTEIPPYSFFLMNAENAAASDALFSSEYAVFLVDDVCQMPLPSMLGIAAQVVLTIPSAENDATCALFSLLGQYVSDQEKRIYEQFATNKLLDILFQRLQMLTLEKTVLTEADSNTAALVELREQIYHAPARNWSIDEMCERVRLSRAHLQRVYSDTFGCSCYQDVLQSRLSRADSLLTKTDSPISIIAQQCGFESDSTFIRAFKKIRGCTPTAFRQARLL